MWFWVLLCFIFGAPINGPKAEWLRKNWWFGAMTYLPICWVGSIFTFIRIFWRVSPWMVAVGILFFPVLLVLEIVHVLIDFNKLEGDIDRYLTMETAAQSGDPFEIMKKMDLDD